MKLLSIITIHLQDFDGLRATFKSIRGLSAEPRTEWIVIDGGSRPGADADRRLLAEVEDAADRFISEPDDGIYDAMNKGVRLATGEYLLFLNAGDRLTPEFRIETIADICANQKPGMIWAHVMREYADGKFGRVKCRKPRWAWATIPVCHQAVFFSRKLFDLMEYDTSLRIASDYDLLLRALKSGACVYLLDQVISEFTAGGFSQQQGRLARTERDLIRQKHYKIPTVLNKALSLADRAFAAVNAASPAFYRFWRRRV